MVFAFTSGLAVSTAAAAEPIVIPPPACDWSRPDNPHVSTYNRLSGATDIKVGVEGKCVAGSDPITVTVTVTLERDTPLLWLPVKVGDPIRKTTQNNPASFKRGQSFALLSPCVPGTYRGWLDVKYTYEGTDRVVFPDFYTAAGSAVVIDCLAADVSMVIDDTGSMGPVIGSVKAALNDHIASRPEDEYTRWSLTTFKDSPTNVGTTEDRAQITGWVNAVSASGGGDCPEDALGGITAGLDALGTDPHMDRQMIVATDASAHGADIDGIIARATAAGVRVNVLLTGDCGEPAALALAQQDDKAVRSVLAPPVSSQAVLKRIAQATGGKYYFLPDGTTADFTTALNEIFATINQHTPPPTTPAPSPSPSNPGLPVTGQSILPLAVTGTALIITGSILVRWARRRRTNG